MSAILSAQTPDPSRLFLSGFTADFGPLRISLSGALSRGQLHTIHQADFPQTQADTVLKLAQLIAPCGVLIHLIGQKPGSVADSAAVAEYLAFADKDGGFLKNLPSLRAALGDFSGITYTQWEVLIALHLGITVFVYGDATHREPAHPQRVHIDRLVAARRYTDSFANEAELKDKIWADLMFHYRQSLPATQVPEIFRPSNLPGIYSGSLFLGRDTFLRDLRASLLKKTLATAITHTAAATGIAGLGGIGKTYAAVEYARRHHADYTATLFVSGDSPDRLDAGFSALFDTLNIGTPGEVQRDQAVRITAVKDWFATHHDWLLIVDNVDDEVAAAAFTGYLGFLTAGHVLITSRLQNWGRNVEALNIEVLSADDSTDLLLQLTEGKRRRTDDEATEARRLADLLEGLPLALHQAAGYISEQQLTFTSYIAEYEAEAASLLDWFESHIIPYERPDMLAPRPVLITWKTSFEKLDADTRFWLLVFAHFASDLIPEFLLDSAPDAANEVKTRHRVAKRAVIQAAKYSLLTRYDDPPRFKLHRLVQHILRLTATEADRAAALAMGIQLFAENNLGNPQDVRTWSRWSLLIQHAAFLCCHSPDESAPELLSWLLSELGSLLHLRSLWGTAEQCYLRALNVSENSLGHAHRRVARDLHNLASLFLGMNRLGEAEPLMRRAVQILEDSGVESQSQLALALNNLGLLLFNTKRLVEAEPVLRRALSIHECLGSSFELEVARDLSNLAFVFQATNRSDAAVQFMRRALEIDEKIFGQMHSAVVPRLDNLVSLLQASRRFTEVELFVRRVLQIEEANFGLEHSNVGIRLNNLAQILMAMNRHPEAVPLMRGALGIAEASYGPDHPNVASRLNSLAWVFHAVNQLSDAEPLMQRALGIFVRSLGLEHPNSQTAQRNYIALLQALEVPEAEIGERVMSAVSGSGGSGAD